MRDCEKPLKIILSYFSYFHTSPVLTSDRLGCGTASQGRNCAVCRVSAYLAHQHMQHSVCGNRSETFAVRAVGTKPSGFGGTILRNECSNWRLCSLEGLV